MPAEISQTTLNGLPVLTLACASGSRAVVSPFGGQVLSWVPAGGAEWLFLSDRARLDRSQAIRGGIPVCFPQFGTQGKLPRHGFARTREWTLDTQRCGADFALLTLTLQDDDASWAIWPQGFRAELSVLIEDNRLDIELEVENTGHAPFAFSGALHTYLRVAEVEQCRLHGLRGSAFRDQLDPVRSGSEPFDALTPDGAIDRIYSAAPPRLVLEDGARSLVIQQSGFTDVVVWNPWDAACAQMADMPPLGFRHMLCVEPALASQRQQVDAGETWIGRQTLISS